MALQALLRFPGVQQVMRWSYTMSHGITPGVCTIDIVPQFGVPAEVGTLQVLFGSVRLQFPGFVVDAARVRRSTSGMVVGLTLLDRRWKWKYGTISGRYNLRTSTGDLDRDTEKSPQELAALLLQALGEAGFSVSELPNVARPEVDWDLANPAGVLAALCEQLGCRVVLGLDNRVHLCRTGVGALLPAIDAQRTVSLGIDPPERPDSLLFVGGPSRWQTQFRLEAVGEDSDGTVRPIDELDYAPEEGWTTEPWIGFPNIDDAENRARATRSVYRWYRILCTAPAEEAGIFLLPGRHGQVEELWQVLPLENRLIDTEAGPDGIDRPQAPYIEGTWWDEGADGENLEPRRFEGQFTLDTARGIVRFREPMVRRDPDDDTIHPAELYLTVAHPLHEQATRAEVRCWLERRMPGAPLGTGAQVVRRDDVVETFITRYSPDHQPTDVESNTIDVEREANAALDAALAQFQVLATADVEYAGIVPIPLDGAIQQVVWSGSPQGAVTRASRNQEFSIMVPSWKERRASETNRLAQENTRRLIRAAGRLQRGER